MTPKRAIEILNPEHREYYDSIETVNEACRIGMDAIGYRIKKKPLAPISKLLEMGRCPNCNAALFDKNLKFCGDCGQALDWSDKE